MNILFYQPYNQQVVYIESIAEKFAENGAHLSLVTHDDWGSTHDNFHKFATNIHCLPAPKLRLPILYHIYRIVQIVKLCKALKIDFVYSHYQESNFISVFAQFFTKARFIITRHHSDCAILDQNRKEMVGDYFINKLSKTYIAPSKLVYDQMVKSEKTNPQKVHLINYGYSFDNFVRPNPKEVEEIKAKYPCELLLVKAARFIPEKRHNILLEVVKKLVDQDHNIKLLLLGRGPLEEDITHQIAKHQLERNVFIIGYKTNVQDYYAAAELLVHLSISEASNSAIKEVALTETPVAVCENVGDFSDYIRHEDNGYILNKETPSTDLIELLKSLYKDRQDSIKVGTRLKKTVLDRFEVSKVMDDYYQLHKQIN